MVLTPRCPVAIRGKFSLPPLDRKSCGRFRARSTLRPSHINPLNSSAGSWLSSRGTLRTCETHPAVLRRALLLTRPRSDSGTVFIRALASALFTGAARGRLAHAVIRPANYAPSDGARSPSLLSVPVLAGFRTITCRALCPARQALQTLLADRPRHAPAAPASSIRHPADGPPSVQWLWLRRRCRAPR